VLVIVGVLVLAFVVAKSCQQSQIRFTKEQAIAVAERRVDFEPRRTQVRLLRQGINSRPYWIVSLSIPDEDGDGFRRLTVVRLDANTGKVAEIDRDR
jgi:hypothetical protein